MPVFPITGSDFECHIYETQRIATAADPSSPTGPGWRARIRRITEAEWINIPSRYSSPEEAQFAVRDYLNEHFNEDEPD